MRITQPWKQDMSCHHALRASCATRAQRHPCTALVLALEGHGAGYLPGSIDAS